MHDYDTVRLIGLTRMAQALAEAEQDRLARQVAGYRSTRATLAAGLRALARAIDDSRSSYETRLATAR